MGKNWMSVEEILELEQIRNIKPLDTLKVNAISKHVAQKICDAFPGGNLDYKNLFIEIARLNMYSATMPDNLAQAKYYYRNSSIYFNENVDFNNLDGFAIHECLHYLQSVKDANGELSRLGLCNFAKSKHPGIALNEAAVQLITTKCTNSEPDSVKYYGIELTTTSPAYYPLQCNLVNQMAYITGFKTLFESTLYSNDDFKKKFIGLTSKTTYYDVELNIDYLMELEDSLSTLSASLEGDLSVKELDKVNDKIAKTKSKIVTVFLGVQKLIYTSYFNNYYNSLVTKKDVENFKEALVKYRDLVGVTETNSGFNEFYVEMMAKADKKYEEALNPSMALTTVNTNSFASFLTKLRNIFKGHNKYTADYYYNPNN